MSVAGPNEAATHDENKPQSTPEQIASPEIVLRETWMPQQYAKTISVDEVYVTNIIVTPLGKKKGFSCFFICKLTARF
jgi:hypothetical protein